MFAKSRRRQHGPPRRTGFTLVELLMVIVIIALLIALLFPAVSGAIRGARDAEVRSEISQLETAITTFKTQYGGTTPPSHIHLSENSTNWETEDLFVIRRIWPQFNPNLDRDFNGDGQASDTFELDGRECLVFFLGGIPENQGTQQNPEFNLTGFSKNPADPFGSGSNRAGPFFEFDVSRFVDQDQDGFPEFLGPLPGQTQPYIYLSAYDGKGYRSDDWAHINAVTGGNFSAYTRPGGNPYKPNTQQIISPGVDGFYGTGGEYDPDDTSNLSQQDRDNITNFSSGRLAE